MFNKKFQKIVAGITAGFIAVAMIVTMVLGALNLAV